MKINFKETKIYTPDGEVMRQQGKSGILEGDVDVKDILITAMRQILESDRGKNAKDVQNEDFKILCKLITPQPSVELSSEDVSRIKEKLAQITDPWTYGQISMILEGEYDKLLKMFF